MSRRHAILARLKGDPAKQQKIAALLDMGDSEHWYAAVERVLDETVATEKAADLMNVRYKAVAVAPAVFAQLDAPSAELKRMEVAIKEARIPPTVAEQVLKAWEQHGEAAALGLLAVYKTRSDVRDPFAIAFQGTLDSDRRPR